MENNIKSKYKLSKEANEEICSQIKGEIFDKVKSEKKPLAIIVGGQSGAGKGSLISYSKHQVEQTGKNITIITTDEYKPYHPNAIEIARKYPTQYVEIIEQDAGIWTGEMLKTAIDNKYNFIFEGTLKNDRILERIKELKEKGFDVTTRVLAVSRLESLISIYERYQQQIANMGWGRLISIDHHNKAYDGIPKVVDKIEKSKLCTVEIYIRGRKINEPQMVYSSKIKNEINPTARIALEQYRNSEYDKAKKTANERIKKIKKDFILRNASNEEIQGIEKLEEYINKKEKNR